MAPARLHLIPHGAVFTIVGLGRGGEVGIPQRARVVVIGGGVIGTSVAYHLASLGWTDIVLLERDKLTSGTTWHAAGLMVTFGSLSETSTEMRKYTRDLYARLESETGQATGLKQVGFIETDRKEVHPVHGTTLFTTRRL